MPKRSKTHKTGVPPPPSETLWIPHGNPDDPAWPATLADAVHRFFEFLTASKGHGGAGVTAARPGKGQWTVVAAFVVLHDVRGGTDGTDGASGREVKVTLCSLASGVKCLGGAGEDDSSSRADTKEEEPMTATGSAWGRDGQLVDMHAEILARRELECLLINEMRWLIRRERQGSSVQVNEDDGDDAPHPILLDLVYPAAPDGSDPTLSTTSRPRPIFRLKPSAGLYLYTSHAPCGAASDAAHLGRLDAEDAGIRALLARLEVDGNPSPPPGPSTSSESEEQVSAFRHAKSQEVPPIVKKPSRADAEPTSAFSCSDKLGRWQCLGFQGGRLAALLAEPVRIAGLVVGEDFEEGGLHRIFGGGPGRGYSRVGRVREVCRGREGECGARWLDGLDEPCRISQTTSRFAHGREATTPTPSASVTPSIPPDVEWDKIRHLPLPLLRDILLPPRAAPTPFPVALAYHAYSVPQAIGPNGRLSGVTRDKRTRTWAENSVPRVARGRMWDAYEELVREYEAAFGTLERQQGRRKGGPGWREASAWMEERGPYAGWHDMDKR